VDAGGGFLAAGGDFVEAFAGPGDFWGFADFATVRYLCIFSSLFGPMPLIAWRSPTLLKVP